MTINSRSVKPQAPLNPLKIVASVLFLMFGIISVILAIQWSHVFYSEYLAWDSWGNDGWATLELTRFVFSLVTPLGAFAVGVLGLLAKGRWLQLVLGTALFSLVFPVQWIHNFLVYGFDPYFFRWTQVPLREYVEAVAISTNQLLGWVSLAVISIALLLSLLGSLTSRAQASAQGQDVLNSFPQDDTQATSQSPSTASGNLNNLPMFALIGAFIVPLAGIILGHLSLSYMKKGQLSEQNKGMATAGLILGYVFVGLGFLTGLILFIVLIVSAATGF
jgi:hypothetical protein